MSSEKILADLAHLSTDVKAWINRAKGAESENVELREERDRAREHSRKLVKRLRQIRSFVKSHDGEAAKLLLESANLEAFMDDLIYYVKGVPVDLPTVHDIDSANRRAEEAEAKVERLEEIINRGWQ